MAKKAEGESKIKKSDAMRQAIEAGIDKPQAAAAFIKEKFGIDVKPQVFSTFKSLENKKSGKKSKRGRKARIGVGNSAGVKAKTGSDAAALARGVKDLVEQHGAQAVADMAKVFG